MKRSQDKIKDYVEPQAFDEVKDFTGDPARVLAAYRFTDATSDLLARWLDALADLPAGRGVAHALAGLRGVGKSHLLATFAALAAAPELRPRVTDAHVAVSAKRLSGRKCVVLRVERGTRPALTEELHAACIAACGREAADWPEEPVALLNAAVERTRGGTLVVLIDTAYGREQRVERDDGPLLSQLANAAGSTGAFVALALDDDIAGADGINVALAQTYQIDYLEPEHLYRIVDLYLLRKQARARMALHEIYLTLRHTVPNFNWSEPRFAALYPIHPLVADVAAAVRFYAPTFAFLPFASSATMQALNRPVLSLILLDEVFDRTEAELRRAKDLQEAFAVYDELSTNGVAQFPALQRLQVRLVLKLLFILSLDGRGASARDLCAALLFHDEAAPQAAVQRIEAMLQQLSSLAPSGRLPARAQEGELHYRFQIGAASEFDAALTAAVERLDADEETLRRTLSEFARARFSDWPFADANAAAIELHLNWRGTSRRGRFAQQATDAVAHEADVAANEATAHEWELIALTPGATLPTAKQAAPATDANRIAASANDDARPVSIIWQPAPLTKDDALILRRLLALRTDAALREFIEPALAAHATLSAQCERIWARVYLDGGTILRADVRLDWPVQAQAAPTLAALLAALFDAPFAARFPEHPRFNTNLNETNAAHLSECMLGVVPEADAQSFIEQFALPLGLALERDGALTLECSETALAQSWCQAVLALIERAGNAVVALADVEQALSRAPFGLTRPAQQLVVVALVAQRRVDLVNRRGARLGRGTIGGTIDWPEVLGLVRAAEPLRNAATLTEWARRLTNDETLASIATADGQADVRAALGLWLEDWRAHAIVQRVEQLPDSGLTLRVWRLLKHMRRTFSVAAEACAAALADAISLEEGLQRLADAFSSSPDQFAQSLAQRDALDEFVAGLARREVVRAYLAGAEPTQLEEIECARRELLLLADDAHGLFDETHCARFERLWQEFQARYTEHYADTHARAVGVEQDRRALAETTDGDAWREFEALAQLPFVNRQHWTQAGALINVLRHVRCDLDVRALLETQPTCACSFRLTRAHELLSATARLTEIITRGRNAARRTLALFHEHLAHALHLLAREKSSATAARAARLAESFAQDETPALLTRADVRLITRAFEIIPPPEPLRIAPPDLNHGPLTRAELHARLDDWLAALPQSHAPVEIAGKMASDAA